MSQAHLTLENTNLGGRLPLLLPSQMDCAQKELYKHINSNAGPWAEEHGFQILTADGALIGPFNTALFSPHVSASFLTFENSLYEQTSLTDRLREVVILTVGSIWKSPYELYAHSAIARKVGLSDSAIQALTSGKASDELTPPELLARNLTRRLVQDHTIEDSLFAQAHSTFGAKGLVDLVMLAGFYMTVCSLLNLFNVPAPVGVSDGKEHL